MLSSRKKLLTKAVLGSLIISPLVLATVVSCTNSENSSNLGNSSSSTGPSGGGAMALLLYLHHLGIILVQGL